MPEFVRVAHQIDRRDLAALDVQRRGLQLAVRLAGTPREVDRESCVPAVLALHELATNAIKYGALSRPGGYVELRWGTPADGALTLEWEEKDGPPVAPPQRQGMGSRILSMHSPAASFAVEYPVAGVRCAMRLKAA